MSLHILQEIFFGPFSYNITLSALVALPGIDEFQNQGNDWTGGVTEVHVQPDIALRCAGCSDKRRIRSVLKSTTRRGDCHYFQSNLESSYTEVTAGSDLKNVKAIYPGSFDPLTNGHLDLIERGSKIFDELIVGILRNAEKDPLFSLEERREMLKVETSRFTNVRIETFDGLLVEFAVQQRAQAILRGIRAVSDYEYELQMAMMNRKLDSRIETVFMMPAETYSYLSSRLVKEVVRLGGSVKGLVPATVEERLRRKVSGEVLAG
jgi:pantetheine-phosphate adenylyltransferase